jgi:hypothetical protein
MCFALEALRWTQEQGEQMHWIINPQSLNEENDYVLVGHNRFGIMG